MNLYLFLILSFANLTYASGSTLSCINDSIVLKELTSDLTQLRDAKIELAKAIKKYNQAVEKVNSVACGAKRLDRLTVVSESSDSVFIQNSNGSTYIKTASKSDTPAPQPEPEKKTTTTSDGNTEASSRGWPRRYTQWLECSGGKTFDFVKVYSSLADQESQMHGDWDKVCAKAGERFISMTGEGTEYNVKGATSDPALITDSSKPSPRYWPKKYEIDITCVKSLLSDNSVSKKFKYEKSYASVEDQKSSIEDNKNFCSSKNLVFLSATFTLIK